MSDSSVSCEQERPSCLKPDSSATLYHMTPYPADTRASITFPPYCGIYMNGQKIPDWIFSVFLFFSQLDCLAWDNYWKVEWANKMGGKLAGEGRQTNKLVQSLLLRSKSWLVPCQGKTGLTPKVEVKIQKSETPKRP